MIRNAPGMPHNDWNNELFLLTDAVDGATGKEPWTDLPVSHSHGRWSSSSPPSNHGERDDLVSVRDAAYSSYVMEMISKAAGRTALAADRPRSRVAPISERYRPSTAGARSPMEPPSASLLRASDAASACASVGTGVSYW